MILFYSYLTLQSNSELEIEGITSRWIICLLIRTKQLFLFIIFTIFNENYHLIKQLGIHNRSRTPSYDGNGKSSLILLLGTLVFRNVGCRLNEIFELVHEVLVFW